MKSALTHVPQIVIVGGGFAGLQVARSLRRAPARVVLIDRRNFTLFQPLLYQVATGLLSPANIATPLRPLLARQRNVHVVLGEVVGFDLVAQRVLLADGHLDFDQLVVACGSRHHYFGNPDWERHAPGLKSLEDADDIRCRIFRALEQAERTTAEDERTRLLTFVVVGGGPTSVELAGAVAEIARNVRAAGFRTMATGQVRIVLVEASDRILGTFSQAASTEAVRALRALGVEVRLNCRVTQMAEHTIVVSEGGQDHTITAATILWGAGVKASPVATWLAEAAGVKLGPGGRVPVSLDCTLAGHPNIFALGDMAAFPQPGALLPGTAVVAIQQGDYVAKVITARLAGRSPPGPFHYRDLGSMATIGKRLAVADIGRWFLRGRIAWLAWLVLHLMKLVRVESRLLVMIQWGWSYVTWSRSASIITGQDHDRPAAD